MTDLEWGKSEPSDPTKLPPEGAFVLVRLANNSVRIARVSKLVDKAGGHDRAYVRFPDDSSTVAVGHELKEIPYTEEGRVALEYLFAEGKKISEERTEVFGLLRNICREISQRDLIAPDFFREHDSRPTTDEEMAQEILKYVKRFKPVEKAKSDARHPKAPAYCPECGRDNYRQECTNSSAGEMRNICLELTCKNVWISDY
mgnify:FL=1